MGGAFFMEALNTYTASRLKMFLVSLLGKKRKEDDGDVIVTLSRFRGKTYILDVNSKKEE